MTPAIIGPMNVTLGEAIAIERKRQSLSQAKLAEMSGVSRNWIGLIESGYLGTKISVLQAISAALGFELVVGIQPKRIECGRKDDDDEHED